MESLIFDINNIIWYYVDNIKIGGNYMKLKEPKDILITIGIFIFLLILGKYLITEVIPLGYLESSILYLASVIGAALFYNKK